VNPLEDHIRVAILSTGGTIEKTYDETDGRLRNTGSVLQILLESVRLPALDIAHQLVMSKDSLDMTEEDRAQICEAARDALATNDAVIVVHGTDTLAETGEHLASKLGEIEQPVILTGAFRPYEFRDTDALQNVTEALLAARLLPGGVYAVLHNRALKFPGVVKDRARRSFTRRSSHRPSQAPPPASPNPSSDG
jgi:L-asparaginase